VDEVESEVGGEGFGEGPSEMVNEELDEVVVQ